MFHYILIFFQRHLYLLCKFYIILGYWDRHWIDIENFIHLWNHGGQIQRFFLLHSFLFGDQGYIQVSIFHTKIQDFLKNFYKPNRINVLYIQNNVLDTMYIWILLFHKILVYNHRFYLWICYLDWGRRYKFQHFYRLDKVLYILGRYFHRFYIGLIHQGYLCISNYHLRVVCLHLYIQYKNLFYSHINCTVFHILYIFFQFKLK